MSQATILNPFILRVRQRHGRDFLTLDDLPSGEDFKDIFTEFLSSLEGESHVDEEAEKSLKVDWSEVDGMVVDGQVKSGEFGFSAELENLETGDVHHRDTKDCEYIPLYFRVDFRSGQNEAIMVMQRFGVRGAKSVIQQSLQAFLDERDEEPSYTVVINPLITQAAVEEALGGGIQKIRFLKSTIPDDVADDLCMDDNEEVEGTMELVVKAQKGSRWGFTGWMEEIANGKVEASEYLEIQGVTYEEVKLEVDVNGKKKTVPLEDVTERLRMNIDVTEDVEYGGDGHPTLDSIREQVSTRMSDFYDTLGWQGE